MGVSTLIWVCVYGIALKRVDSRQPIADALPPIVDSPDVRSTLRRIYTAEIGVREQTGRNDGPRIGEYLRYVGLDEGYAYCAAFTCWALGEAGAENPKNGWSPALFPAKRIVWSPKLIVNSRQPGAGNPGPSSSSGPQPGDVFGIYYSNLKRIAHCGFVDSWDGTWCITVEANTGSDNAVTTRGDPANPTRAGPAEGVYRKKRLVKTIYRVADWVDRNDEL